ncbi:hypothetical protein HMPREF1981_01047 [Bacteroides pyogenes F0041]|uniref:Uncharacterized protein n=1 Tax=Bacteroides pyogenes F0041 TaxID=1321819 RepID=U2CNX7_9BACE|nr:hypothetical protein HMPREF1981_01047 [Bacteroides pyogenes F0041]GAE22511.1 hypothetical protein JCM10003_2125 [Bacteroides pyogenes JCM 10003]
MYFCPGRVNPESTYIKLFKSTCKICPKQYLEKETLRELLPRISGAKLLFSKRNFFLYSHQKVN